MRPGATRRKPASPQKAKRAKALPRAGARAQTTTPTLPANEELTTLNAQLQEKVHELTSVNDDLENLLVSTDIATVFVDTHLRVKRFTVAATHLLNLRPTDTGRPLSHLATNLIDADLSRDARAVLDTLMPVEREVASRDGKQYLVRLLPYRTEESKVHGAVLTLVDITSLKRTERELRAARDELSRMNERLEERVAERTKWLTLVHEVTRTIDEATAWTDALSRVLRGLCEIEHWQVAYVYVPDPDDPGSIIPVASHVSEDRFLPFHAVCEEQRYALGDRMPGGVLTNGVPLWVNDMDELRELVPVRAGAARRVGLEAAVAVPITVGGQAGAALELFSDRPHTRSPELSTLMLDVGSQLGQILERAQMVDLVWREQQGLLHTLHDSLGQTLTGLGLLSNGLGRRLADADAETAEVARQVAQQAQEALTQVRQLARDLFPVEIEAEGLSTALCHLAATTESLHKISVRVDAATTEPVRDGRVATQLYRIAQEALTNAVKHANARTITIRLHAKSGLTTLRIRDDGVGMSEAIGSRGGVGLRIMRYRANSVGGVLTVESGAGTGTTVMCTIRNTRGR